MSDIATPGVASGRLGADELATNFADLHAPMEVHEAQVAADRCYFCYDAPCITACPTRIDIPLFIRQIQTGTPDAAARTIFDSNILGGMCARVCPTEELCEEACVREIAEGQPVQIGRLQRHATDGLMAKQGHPYGREAATGRRVAVVGAGPAGLACAHRLAMKGHDVTLIEAREKPGGLNEYGIAAYKTPDDFAAKEVAWLMQIGGIALERGRLGESLTLEGLLESHDAVFLGVGLGGVNALKVEGADREGVEDAVAYIADLRQAADLATLPIGRDVVVIGGGMTAIDIAVQARALGAQRVTLAYRRRRSEMGASRYERDLAASRGVTILERVMPVAVHGNGAVREIELEGTRAGPDGPKGTGERFRLPADQVFRAIGQTLRPDTAVGLARGRIAVTGRGRTDMPGVWAGGDCTDRGSDLTVEAVAQGRDAAEDIDAALCGRG